MNTHSEAYVLQEAHSGLDVMAQLAPEHVVSLPEVTETVRYFDTFDWRLYRAGFALKQVGSTVSLQGISNDEAGDQVQVKRRTEGCFWWEFPEGAFRNRLKEVLSIRALLPRTQVRQRVCKYDILNADKKTVVRACITHTEAEDNPTSLAVLVFCSVRGYERDFETMRCRFADLSIGHPVVNTFEPVMHLAGCVPGDYSSKVDLVLVSNATGSGAARDILRRLSTVIRQNEVGLRADWDTEFLHDFRVAIRRTRSALSQIKGVFPEDAVAHFKDKFRDLGKATNRLRDLDVYLLEEDAYRAMLPQSLQHGLNAMFARLKKERRSALRNMIHVLDASDYTALMDSWDAFLNGAHTWVGDAPVAGAPAIDLARKFIRKRFKHVLKRGRAIGDDTPKEALHSLRINCKKLRYTLEFFSSFFPADAMGKTITHLKQLQDNLGDFNDLLVQQQELMAYLNRVLPRSRRENRLMGAAAIGGLIAQLHGRQQIVRRAFANSFAAFAGPENVQLYRSLFGK